MILLVIRHGESEADILDVHEGRADFELTQKGHRQAAAMAKYVAGNFQLIRIYSSTLKRAAQTAKHLSDETGTAVEYEPSPLIRQCTVRNPKLHSAAEPSKCCRECFQKTVQSPS